MSCIHCYYQHCYYQLGQCFQETAGRLQLEIAAGRGGSRANRAWVGKELFAAKGKLNNSLKLWYHPPAVEHQNTLPSSFKELVQTCSFSPLNGVIVTASVLEEQANEDFPIEKCTACEKKVDELGILKSIVDVKWRMIDMASTAGVFYGNILQAVAVTSTYGRILKIDSTKKVCRKLQGKAANTASWATSVGNERGEVLITVLTSSEGGPALKPLADGLVGRYRAAEQPSPVLLYRDCCGN